MAELTRTSPPTGSVAEREVLLATKLHIPHPAPGFLSRERLAERLAEGMARELTLVCTPAGFGKTTLLGDWARRSPQPTVWLSLDEADNDPARLWRYVAAALDPLCDGVAEQVDALLRGPQPASLEAVVTAVINAVADRPDRLALVLDDLHLVEAPPVHDSLRLLLDRLPAQLQLVLASRADPPLPLGPTGCRSYTATRPPGTRTTGWPMTPSITPWRPGTPDGLRGWSSGTSKGCTAAARSPPSNDGSPRFPPIWSARDPRCVWPWPHGRTSPAGWRTSRRCSTTPNGRCPEPTSRSSRRWAGS